MKQKLLAICLVFLLTFGLASSVSAQSYSFSLDKEVVNVYWNSDGTTALDYQLTFTNSPGGHVIDFVDVGMPNGNYVAATADVGGNAVSISSDYQGQGSYGFSVDMGAYAIQPGQTGTVHVYVGRVSQVLYADDNDTNYASAVFSPTWFGSQYVNGTTDLSVTFHLPPGVKPEEPRWHASPSGFPSEPQSGIDPQGRVTYAWNNPSASGSTQYTFGASFPKSYVPADAIITTPPFDFAGLITLLISNFSTLLCCGFIAFMFVGLPALTAISNQRRKLQYLPPRVAIEGHGIKRGLTAVEAAILMEQPLDKVMTMILFGVIKKGAAQVITREPLELEISKDEPAGLQQYEKDFLKAFKEKETPKRRGELQDMTIALVKSVSEKMRGFSRRESVDYYKSITEKAWAQVEAADTPEVKSQKFDEGLEWTMLDRDYDDRTRRVFHGPIFLPRWWGGYDPAYRPSTTTASARPFPVSSPTSSSKPSTALPGADFAAQMVTGVQTFSQKVIGNVNTFTENVTGKTNPPPKPSPSSYRGGGGGGRSCACACACAGCACACAGGGR